MESHHPSDDDVTSALRAKLESARLNSRGRRQYGPELRAEVVAYAEPLLAMGLSRSKIASRLGVNGKSISDWCGPARPRREGSKAMRRVSVVASTAPAEEPVLHGPKGTRVTGLDLVGLGRLLAALHDAQ